MYLLLEFDYQIGFDGFDKDKRIRKERATRLNSRKDKKINRFIILCVEQYSKNINSNSRDAYSKMLNCGVIKELQNDYEDLHGMSTEYLNEYIDSFVRG